jgi:hypothetical protein
VRHATKAEGGVMRSLILFLLLVLGSLEAKSETIRERLVNDPVLQRCIAWMLDGYRGAFIQDICLDDHGIPPPSLFMCARKVSAGFASSADQEGCAILFDEQAKKARAGYVKQGAPCQRYDACSSGPGM